MKFKQVFLYLPKGSIKKNIVLLTFVKVLSTLIGFLMVPLILSYLDTNKYGIWLILSSIIGWFGILDFGIGNGTRNLLGKAWAIKDYSLARKIVSSSYAVTAVLVIIWNILFWTINPFIDWINILNIDSTSLNEVKKLISFMFIFISLRMLTCLILPILYVDHRPAMADFIVLLSNIFSFSFILYLSLITKNSLIYIGLSLTFFSLIVPFFASIWFFKNDYKLITPSYSQIDFSKIKNLLSQGLNFSILQISTLVLTMTDMLIITQLYGPEEVVPYNIAFKLFSYVIVLFGIVVAPFWASYNEAFHKENFSWIKQVTNKLIKIWFFVSIGVFIMILFSSLIYSFWIGEKIIIPYSITICMGLYVIFQILNTIFTTFLFSTGKLKILTSAGVLVAVINIPLCIFLAKNLNFGVSGIIAATVICTLFNLLIAFIQYNKILNHKDYGIWSK